MLLLNPLPQRLDTGATPTFAGLLAGDGTAAAPSISFAADSDTGFYRRSDNAIGFAIGGVAQGYMVSSGSAWRIANGISSGTRLDLFDSGAISLVSAGNQNISLTPNGTGQVVFEKRVVMSTGQGGTAASPAYSFVDAGAYGLYYVGGTAVGISAAGNQTLTCFGSGVTFLGSSAVDSGNGRLQLATHTASTGGIGFGTDTSLYRSAAGTLTIQGATNTILQFAEGASASVRIQQSSGACYIDTQSAQPIILRTNNTTALTIDASQGATFAAGITTGGSIVCAAGGTVQWNGRSAMGAPSDGVIRLTNNGGSDFSRLQFGGTTTSFPALARTGTTLSAVLADGSAYAPFSCSALSLFGALKLAVPYVGGVGAATGYLTVQDSTGTTYKIPVLA